MSAQPDDEQSLLRHGDERDARSRSGDEVAVRDANSAEAVAGVRLPSAWRMLLGVAAGLAVGAAAVMIFNPHLGRDLATAEGAAVQPWYLLPALGCMAVALATDAWSLVVLARVFRPDVRSMSVVSTALESHLVGGTTSFGGLEIPYQIVLLRHAGLTGYQSTSVVVFKGLVHTVLLTVVALVSLLPWVNSPITSLQRWIIAAATCALLVLWLVGWLWLRRPLGRGLLPAKLRKGFDEVVASARAVSGASVAEVLGLVILQVIYWVAMFAVLVFVLYALGWRGSIVPIITGQAVTQVLMPLSPLPGGAGVAEFGYLALIGPSLPQAMRVSSLVLWRLFTWVVPVAVGALSLGVRGMRRV